MRIACIGPSTADTVREFHLKVDVVSNDAVAEKLVEALQNESSSWEDVRVLLPRAEEARDVLPESLRKWGAQVDVVTAYRTIPAGMAKQHIIDDIIESKYDIITFSSSSTFTNFVKLIGGQNLDRIRGSLKAASIGPVTSATIRASGVEPCVEAGFHTIAGLVEAIERYITE